MYRIVVRRWRLFRRLELPVFSLFFHVAVVIALLMWWVVIMYILRFFANGTAWKYGRNEALAWHKRHERTAHSSLVLLHLVQIGICIRRLRGWHTISLFSFVGAKNIDFSTFCQHGSATNEVHSEGEVFHLKFWHFLPALPAASLHMSCMHLRMAHFLFGCGNDSDRMTNGIIMISLRRYPHSTRMFEFCGKSLTVFPRK